jgi:glycosyltransferase involved in cell wall biosynthesis
LKKISILLPSLRIGGAERLSINLANEWSKNGYIVEIVTLSKAVLENDLSSLLHPDVQTASLDSRSLRRSIFPISRYLKKTRPDILISAMWPLTIISILSWIISGRQGKLIVSEHTQLSISMIHEFAANKFLLRASIFIFYNLASGVIAVSKGVKEDICSLGKLKKNRVQVIYNPISSNNSSLNKNFKDPYLEKWLEPGYKILAVGTLKKQKDFSNLIKAVNDVSVSKKLSLIILGEGPEREALENLILSLNLQASVFMPGFVLDPERYFKFSDLFVLSSAWEGFGNVLVEALETGTPVVSTNCKSGPSEILENGKYGKLVPIQNHKALARGIEDALNEDHNHSMLIERAQLFSVKEISKKYLEYFRSCP